jgi:hypothetical protein
VGGRGLLLGIAILLLAAAPAAASKVIYLCGDDLCRVEADGSGKKRLTRDGSKPYRGLPSAPYEGISASRDGRRLVFHRAGDTWLADSSARNRRELKFAESGFGLHPDGNTFASFVATPGYRAHRLCRGTLSPLRQSCHAIRTNDRSYAAWGPDRTLVSTHADTRGDICVTDWRKDPPRCTRTLARAGQGETFFGSPSLSPDERQLATTLDLPGGSELTAIAVFDVRTARRVRLLTSGAEYDTRPRWSPDGRQVLFTRWVPPSPGRTGAYSIVRVPAGGGKARVVVPRANESETDIVWVR